MISDKIRAARKAKGYTQEQLGEILGVAKQTIQKYESGTVTNIPLDRFQALADALGVSPISLMDLPDFEEVKITGFIPVYGTIAAGQPIFADENIIDYIATTHAIPTEYFALKVRGTSMIGAGIPDGAYVTIKKQNTAENGDIVACRINGEEATLKRFRQQGSTVVLMPENPEYDPIIVSVKDFESGRAQILGIAKEVTSKV
ncbi:MAG: helix-turn-helix domain-containing protein [Clostridia bacterium]|nr:helix-turn-helix domain-containing protein [Clostridia bacterium]